MQPKKPELAERLELAGLTLSLTDDLGLRVTPASVLTPTLREEIKAAKAALVDWLLATMPAEPFTEPPGYVGTGWRLAGADGLSAATLAKFYAASQMLDSSAHQGKTSKHWPGFERPASTERKLA